MKWEVSGADRNTGEDRSAIIEADNEESARRRGARAGLMVADVRIIEDGDSVHGVPAILPIKTVARRASFDSIQPPPQPAPVSIVHGVGAININTSTAPLKNGWGIAAVILGAIAFVLAFVPCIGMIGAIPLGAIGIILGGVGLIIGYSYERPVIASWLGIGGCVAAVALAIAVNSLLAGGVGAGVAAVSQQAAQQIQATNARIQAEHDRIQQESARAASASQPSLAPAQ